MTDYGQFYAINGKLRKVDDEPRNKPDRCSTSGSVKSLINYARKLNELRQEAAKAGVCLDELEEAAKELKGEVTK